MAALPEVALNGSATHRLPHNLNLTFGGVDGGDLIDALDGLAVASGSACSSAEPAPSHVLRALGLDDRRAGAALRISLGRDTTLAEIDAASEEIMRNIKILRGDI
jgi:cysteine desulfurase